jgi:delta 1-pyrroline-5-carboxylate dehydrogenase
VIYINYLLPIFQRQFFEQETRPELLTLQIIGTTMTAATYPEKLDFSTFSNIINGQVRGTAVTRHGVNPSTCETLPPCPVSTQADVEEAVQAARSAFKLWKTTPIEVRKENIKGLAAALLAQKEDFSRLLIKEQGKPVSLESWFK